MPEAAAVTNQAPSRTIGLGGAISTLVGFVVGASIYILPGAIAAEAGPGVLLSYGIACLMALFGCVVAAHVSVAFPASGASFIIVGRLVSPFAGFLCVWLLIGAAAVAIALLGHGFADYAGVWVGKGNHALVGAAVIVLFACLNLVGVRESLSVQHVMVVVFIIALLIFSAVGLLQADPANFRPFLPQGFVPALAGAIPAFFSYAGFMIIIELGGEIRNPGRTIPLALMASFLIVLLTYSLVSLAVVGVVPWPELAGIEAPVAEASRRILPGPLANFVTFTALAAIVSSINAMLMGYSRDVFILARVGVLPGALATTHGRNGTPIGGVLALSVLGLGTFMVGATITDYATFIVVCLMFVQLAIGVAALKLVFHGKGLESDTAFQWPPAVLGFFAIGLCALSLVFIALTVFTAVTMAAAAGAWLVFGMLYYSWRRTRASSQGQSLEQRLLEVTSGGECLPSSAASPRS